jgi:hypothetical protein
MNMTMQKDGKYVAAQIPSQDSVYENCKGLPIPNVVKIWQDALKQFRDPQGSALSRFEGWVKLQATTADLMDKFAWDFKLRAPYSSMGGNPAKNCSYAQEDFYSNPSYGWCD